MHKILYLKIVIDRFGLDENFCSDAKKESKFNVVQIQKIFIYRCFEYDCKQSCLCLVKLSLRVWHCG